MRVNPAPSPDSPLHDLDSCAWNHVIAPIRRSDDGYEFFLLSEAGVCEEEAEFRVAETAEMIPAWDRANPVARYERVRLVAFAIE